MKGLKESDTWPLSLKAHKQDIMNKKGHNYDETKIMVKVSDLVLQDLKHITY